MTVTNTAKEAAQQASSRNVRSVGISGEHDISARSAGHQTRASLHTHPSRTCPDQPNHDTRLLLE
jgi:hypothetical protein